MLTGVMGGASRWSRTPPSWTTCSSRRWWLTLTLTLTLTLNPNPNPYPNADPNPDPNPNPNPSPYPDPNPDQVEAFQSVAVSWHALKLACLLARADSNALALTLT